MRRIVKGKPLLVVTAAATAALMAGCNPAGPPPDAGAPDASIVSGNLDVGRPVDAHVLDGGAPDTSVVSGNLSVIVPDAGTDGGVDGGP